MGSYGRNLGVPPRLEITLCGVTRDFRWPSQSPPMFGPYWRLYWNKNAAAEIWTETQRITPSASELLLIAPETRFQRKSLRPMAHFYMHFVAAPPFDEAPSGLHVFRCTPWHREMMTTLNNSESVTRAAALCHDALSRVAMPAQPDTQDARITQAVELLHTQLDRDASIPDLATDVGMHPNAFIRLFKNAVGEPPKRYHDRRRIHEACRRLQETDASIAEIAADLGFVDRYHFSRVFKRFRGVPPGAYRRARE